MPTQLRDKVMPLVEQCHFVSHHSSCRGEAGEEGVDKGAEASGGAETSGRAEAGVGRGAEAGVGCGADVDERRASANGSGAKAGGGVDVSGGDGVKQQSAIAVGQAPRDQPQDHDGCQHLEEV